MKTIILKTISASMMLILLNGCFLKPYRFDIQQGNIIESEKVAQIHPGMTEDQVRFILGTPLLQDVFHTNRWDYIYYLNPQHGEIEKRHLVVFFSDGVVESISEDSQPYAKA